MNYYTPLFRNVLYPFYEKVLRGRPSLSYLNDYQSNLDLSLKELEALQLVKLKKILQHCADRIPYYQKVFERIGLDNIDEQISSISDFECIPVLTKELIRENHHLLVLKDNNNLKKATGGSTGQSLQLELDHNSELLRNAVAIRGYDWLGGGLGVKTFYLWGADLNQTSASSLKTRLYERFYNRRIMNSFHMNMNNLFEYTEAINQYKPEVIVSYTSPLFMLAKFILENNIEMPSIKSIITGAEGLNDEQRHVIEKAFNCPTYNTYGSRETMLIGAECSVQKGFHVNIDHLVVETLDTNHKSIKGSAGEVAVTDLSNYGMPFIRYINGDIATLTDSPCPCDNPLPMMSKVNGRKLDILKSADGSMIPGEFFPHLMKDQTNVVKYQVQQSCLTQLNLKLVINNAFSEEDELKILSSFSKINGSLKLKINIVDDIPLTKSGKHRVTICEV